MAYQITHVVVSDDGSLVAATSVDGGAQVWDSETKEPVTLPLQHPKGLHWASFTAGANQLLTLCSDGRGYLWNLSPLSRSRDSLEKLCTLISGEGAPDAPASETRWEDLRTRWGEVLGVAPEAIAAWHRQEAQRCEDNQQLELA